MQNDYFKENISSVATEIISSLELMTKLDVPAAKNIKESIMEKAATSTKLLEKFIHVFQKFPSGSEKD